MEKPETKSPTNVSECPRCGEMTLRATTGPGRFVDGRPVPPDMALRECPCGCRPVTWEEAKAIDAAVIRGRVEALEAMGPALREAIRVFQEASDKGDEVFNADAKRGLERLLGAWPGDESLETLLRQLGELDS